MGAPASARGGSCTRPHALPVCPAFAVGISRLASFLRVLASVLILSLGVSEVSAQEIRYLYDDLGRLVGVVDQQGNAAEYVYDAVGNILQIRRVNITDFPGPVAITFFDPKRGEVGTPVTIFGKGFSPSPADNQVAFSGTVATVTASTGTSLETTVPSGATTGPITITTPLGSATSSENFTVLQPVTVSPTTATALVGGTVLFTANTAVEWKVNNRVGGDAATGTITPGGLYRAPAAPPNPPEVTVTAVSRDDPRFQASALVTILPVPERFTAPAVSAQFAEPRQANALPGPLVSIQFAEPRQANALPGPLIAATFAPMITSLSPDSGVAGGTPFPLTVGGNGLGGATNLQFVRNGAIDPNVTVSSVAPAADGLSLTATIAIAGAAAPGLRTVRVVTPAATSTILPFEANTFTVTSP
jgi:YD repeat-containing protein